MIGAFDDEHGDRVAALYEGFDAPIVRDERPVGGDDQARVERLPRNEDQLHQRDRERVRSGRGRHRRGRAGNGARKRIGTSYLRPGIGYGGSCYPKDVPFLKLLAGNSGYHFQLLTAVMEVNDLQKRRLVGKLKEHLGDLRGKTIALLGLAFKPERTTCAMRRRS